MSRIEFKDFKAEALKDAEVNEAYTNLKLTYELRTRLISLRKASGLTQEELAMKLKTQKSNISRLENVNSKNSPRLATIEEYANAMGYEVNINFTPVQ